MIVCFGFQFLESAVFDLSISLSSVLCHSISLSLFSLGLSVSLSPFFYPCSNLSFFCLQQLISFYTKRTLMSGLVSQTHRTDFLKELPLYVSVFKGAIFPNVSTPG